MAAEEDDSTSEMESSSRSSSELSLHYSSSPYTPAPHKVMKIQKKQYMYEPDRDEDEESGSSDDESGTDRLRNNDW